MPQVFRVYFERLWHAYHRTRRAWPIWYYCLNRSSRKAWARHTPGLGAVERTVVAALERVGIAIVPFGELFGDSTLFPALQARAAWRRTKSRPPDAPSVSAKGEIEKDREKRFMRYLWGGGGTYPVIERDDPFIGFTLDQRILGIVGAYLGSAPKLQGFSLQETRLVSPGSPQYLSQRWHRDPDDKKLVKVFLYLSDVSDDGAGPFMYVTRSHYGGRWRNLYPQRPPVGRYPPPGAVEASVPAGDIQVCLGGSGTLIFCDTSGLHRGGYSTSRSRLMFVAGFVSAASRFPISYRQPPEFDRARLSPLAGYALES